MKNNTFQIIADDLEEKGYCIIPDALPKKLCQGLYQHALQLNKNTFTPAEIGRGTQKTLAKTIRSDKIYWIDDNSPFEDQWLEWSTQLMHHLNRHLYLGLSFFESHFALYQAGDFYKRHLDAFQGNTNRIISLIAYLNPNWQSDDGGELVIYCPNETQDQPQTAYKIPPKMGTVVVFLSEQFPHEVLPTQKERLSIAGWFRKQSGLL